MFKKLYLKHYIFSIKLSNNTTFTLFSLVIKGVVYSIVKWIQNKYKQIVIKNNKFLNNTIQK